VIIINAIFQSLWSEEVSYAHQGFIYMIRNTVKKYKFNSKQPFLILNVFMSSVSHDPTEIILICWLGESFQDSL